MEYQLDASQVHYCWDRSIEPRLRIASGDTVVLEPLEAYALCSVAVDLKIAEVVDEPNWVVTALLPLSIFKDGSTAGRDPTP